MSNCVSGRIIGVVTVVHQDHRYTSLRWRALGARNIDPRTHSRRGLFIIIRDGAQPDLKISPPLLSPLPVMSATTRDEQIPPSAEEDTPLLSSEPPPQKPTPVPWAQVWILLVLQLAEPLTSQVIYPFAPEVCHFLQTRFFSFSSIFHSSFVMLGSPMAMSPV